ncbi:MAG: hypothetical protein WCK37_01530 [Candidatus Falkowbacteria bacterium]
MVAKESDLPEEDEVIIVQDYPNKKKVSAEEVVDDSIDIIEYVEEALQIKRLRRLRIENLKSRGLVLPETVEADCFIGAASVFSDFIVVPKWNAICNLAL